MSGSRNLLVDDPLLDVSMRHIDVDCELRHIVCNVYMKTLQTLPAVVRQWWTGLDKRSSDIVSSVSLFLSVIVTKADLQVLTNTGVWITCRLLYKRAGVN